MGNLDLLEDAAAKLPHTTRAMFGGHGLFAPNGGMFAGIVDDDRIILKLEDAATRAELIALGTAPWVYRGKQGAMTMAQWILAPDEFYDDPRLMETWVARAHRLAPAKIPKPAKARVAKGAAKKAAAKAASKAARSPPPKKDIAKTANIKKTSARRPSKKRASH
jgi:TfoX/Sxy family transcriptional regulator of competence genes